MRKWERICAVVNILLIGWLLFATDKTVNGLLIGFAVAAVVTVVQLTTERFRWPMVPFYIVPLFPLITLLLGGETDLSIVLLTVLALVYIIIALALSLLFPVFSFKKPDGPYKVGTLTYHWTDHAREEALGETPSGKRELMVQIWYPADPVEQGSPEPFLNDADVFIRAMTEQLKLPRFVLSNLRHVRTNSIPWAKLASDELKYPVLLFSHGFGGWKNQNTFQVEQLASQGYIVVGIDHVYNNVVTIFPDGRSAAFDRKFRTQMENLDHIMEEVWLKDAQYVLDQVERLEIQDSRFTGRIDLNRIGMFGYSFGGATTAQIMLIDNRVKAGINMDGGFYGKRVPATGFKQPFMFMKAEGSFGTPPEKFLENKKVLKQLEEMGVTREKYLAGNDNVQLCDV